MLGWVLFFQAALLWLGDGDKLKRRARERRGSVLPENTQGRANLFIANTHIANPSYMPSY